MAYQYQTAEYQQASASRFGDDIGASDEPIVLQPWQQDEARRRSEELKKNPSIAIDRAELWRRVNG